MIKSALLLLSNSSVSETRKVITLYCVAAIKDDIGENNNRNLEVYGGADYKRLLDNMSRCGGRAIRIIKILCWVVQVLVEE